MSAINAVTPERRAPRGLSGVSFTVCAKVDRDSGQRLRRFRNDATILRRKSEPDRRGLDPAIQILLQALDFVAAGWPGLRPAMTIIHRADAAGTPKPVASCEASAYCRPAEPPGAIQGMPWRLHSFSMKAVGFSSAKAGKRLRSRETPTKGSKMPKMKTKSSVKKRFKITGTGKVVAMQAGKRHGMIKRTPKFIRNARGGVVLQDGDARIVKKAAPYGLD
jgi:large subunit ribosomal protein L35